MKANNWYKVLCCCGLQAITAFPVITAEEPGVKTIPLVNVREQKAADAIDAILGAYQAAHPTEVKYDSFVICSDYAATKRISLNLKNVPLEIALNAVADSLALRAVC